MSFKAALVLLTVAWISPALAATDDDADPVLPEDSTPARTAPRHVITQQDHDAAVKAEEIRQHASEQAQAAEAAKRSAAPAPTVLPKDAPVAKTARATASAHPAKDKHAKAKKDATASRSKHDKKSKQVAAKAAVAPPLTAEPSGSGRKPLVAKGN